jgi:hypothetical protein
MSVAWALAGSYIPGLRPKSLPLLEQPRRVHRGPDQIEGGTDVNEVTSQCRLVDIWIRAHAS